jgi:hypothetical protein
MYEFKQNQGKDLAGIFYYAEVKVVINGTSFIRV